MSSYGSLPRGSSCSAPDLKGLGSGHIPCLRSLGLYPRFMVLSRGPVLKDCGLEGPCLEALGPHQRLLV